VSVTQYNWKTKPFQHQIDGTCALIDQPYFALFDEMGVGKSKQVVDAACVLHKQGALDTVIVVAPASVRPVWADPDFGQIIQHSWVEHEVIEFSNKKKFLAYRAQIDSSKLLWVITNYEFIRRGITKIAGRWHIFEPLQELMSIGLAHKTLVVLDESSFIKNHKAKQTRAATVLGKFVARRIILNGMPVSNSPLDLWSQMNYLSSTILPFKNFYAFRARYAVMGGWHAEQVVSYQNLEELQNYIRPYCLRREKKDCLDLPQKLYTQQEAALTPRTWALYKNMRDEAILFMGEHPSSAAQAITKVMRLSQITSGFIGGVEKEEAPAKPVTKEVGCEKLTVLLLWLDEQLRTDSNFKAIIWCRFRLELQRAARDIAKLKVNVYKIHGGQSPSDRADAIEVFGTDCQEQAVLVAQPQAGGFGLNLTAAHTVVYLSNDYNLLTRRQSEDRVHRPGQQNTVTYLDILATGPTGQRTIDHVVWKALRKKQDLAALTVDGLRALLEEE